MEKNVKIALIFLLSFLSSLYLAGIEVSGDQSGTWPAAGNPYHLVGDVTVPAGQNLEVEAGVQLFAQGSYRITVLGTIILAGSETDSIHFQGAEGIDWGGLRLENEAEPSYLSYTRISNTDDTNDYAVHVINSPVYIQYCLFDDHLKALALSGLAAADPAYMEVKHTRIANCEQNGILITDNSDVLIDSCEITQCGLGSQYRGAIQLSLQSASHNCSPVISNCWIHDNGKQGVTMANLFNYPGMAPHLTGNLIEGNLTGIYLYNANGHYADNIIRNNFIPGDANSGAGVMCYGPGAVNGVFTRNEVTGNFTGFYLAGNASADLGNIENADDQDDGLNYIHNNIDEGENLYSVYNDSNQPVSAQNNLWDSSETAEIAETIIDQNDNPTLGLVTFEPIYPYSVPPVPADFSLSFGSLYVNLDWDIPDPAIALLSHYSVYLALAGGDFNVIAQPVVSAYDYEIPDVPDLYHQFYVTYTDIFSQESAASDTLEFWTVEAGEQELPLAASFLEIYPNPFTLAGNLRSSGLQISFQITETDEILLQIFDIRGRLTGEKNLGKLAAGLHHLTWEAGLKDLGSGVYIVSISGNHTMAGNRLILLK
ncbi:MAG: right-handed parallel beta-helix repeat-containing protein [Candidatus Cloacimonetes bacterium]|nr:right-handed parallel beta-helix repeat-containing protein [Candidatus Cloacimonadota bacterium]